MIVSRKWIWHSLRQSPQGNKSHSAPKEFHTEIVRQIIDFNLTSKQVKEYARAMDTSQMTPTRWKHSLFKQ